MKYKNSVPGMQYLPDPEWEIEPDENNYSDYFDDDFEGCMCDLMPNVDTRKYYNTIDSRFHVEPSVKH